VRDPDYCWVCNLLHERDVLAEDLRLAAGDLPIVLPEPGTDLARLVTANRLLRRERDTYAAQLAEALALLAETRRKAARIHSMAQASWLARDDQQWHSDLHAILQEIASLPAPEALRQQQEREAEIIADNAKLADEINIKDALIEHYREALLYIASSRGSGLTGVFRRVAESALKLTPPQALREREERMGALEQVVEIARYTHFLQSPAMLSRQLGAMKDAIAALDSVKGGV
jgi:hypothetical protein